MNYRHLSVPERMTGISGIPENPAGELPGLILQELSDAECYLYLARVLGGPESGRLRELARQEQSHGACLRGIVTLITGTPPEVPGISPEPGQPLAMLRRCYGNTMRRLTRYEARQNHPEYGPVFRKLAAQEQEHCGLILELIGSLRRNWKNPARNPGRDFL